MHPSLDLPSLATCTTCRFKENKSNYWTAVMYFKHTNGSYIRVPQIPNHIVGSPNGGMTVYYIQHPDGGKITAFPKGFRMITGDPRYRKSMYTNEREGEYWSTSFRCWQTTGPYDYSNSHAIGPGPFDSVHLPTRKCPGGIRTNTFFPACWDGVNLDTPDHKSHVAFYKNVNPASGLFLSNGVCPSTHPIHIPALFFETVWDTKELNKLWPEDKWEKGEQPYVLSMGDPTGYGHHGDYVFGWEGDALQRAMDKCTTIRGRPTDCTELTIQTDEEMNACAQAPRVDEKIGAGEFIEALPGCNPIQQGPEPATLVSGCTAVATTIDLKPTATSV
ncbi:hypothetical protein H1R20_g6751, partial [Candolleomyces eurysporus]